MNKSRTPVGKQTPGERVCNFTEVSFGYTEEEARSEAARCIQCKKPSCTGGCPVGIDIPGFIRCVKDGNFAGAIRVLEEKNSLPAICGRVCPQETQCEILCVLGKKGEPVAIGRLERFVADWARSRTMHGATHRETPSGLKVAIVGSGPAGVACAAELANNGAAVTIFESLHLPGGVLSYGIPEFRLPKEIVRYEIEYVKSLGVEIVTDVIVGKTLSLDDLFAAGYRAVFIATGAGLPTFMKIPGENLLRVYSANEFLTRVNLMKSYRFPDYDTPLAIGKRVAVIGGGNVAMDAARCSRRLGAEKVAVLYRRTAAEMPARQEEVENAHEEGIEFQFLVSPLGIVGDEKGYVKGIRIIRNELGEPDQSGRRRPVPIPGSEEILDFDTIIVAVGQSPNPLIPQTVKGLQVGKHGNIVTDPETGATSLPGVYAGGDIATGAATVISAMGAGKTAAQAILHYLGKGNQDEG